MKLAPSILSLDFSKFDEQLSILNSSVEYIHFDVMDGKFVPNKTFDSTVLKRFYNNSNLFLDVHLMVVDPLSCVDEFINAGADSITFHFESFNNDISKCKELLDYIHSKNIKSGISIKPNTDIQYIDSLLKDLDIVLIMSVEPGFGGQKFIDSSLEKVKYLKKMKEENKYSYLIEIDGGINEKTAKLAKDAGVDLLVSGSYIFKGDILSNINKIKSI